MPNPRNFGNGQSAFWRKTLVWRTALDSLEKLLVRLANVDRAEALLWLDNLDRYGHLVIDWATTDRGNPRWHKLLHDTSMLAHNLAQRGARAEVEAEKASG